MKVPYTKGAIDDLPHPESGQKIYWFKERSGFGIRMTPSARSFIFEKRVAGTKRRVTVCKLPSEIDARFLKVAMRKASDLDSDFTNGIDPVAEARKAAAEAARQAEAMITLRDAFKRYADADKQKGAGKGRPKKPRTIRDIHAASERFKDWLDKPVTEITGDMVRQRYREIVAGADAARVKAGKAATGHSAQAELAMRYLRAAMNHVNKSSDDDTPIIRPKVIGHVGNLVPTTPRRKTRNISDGRIPEWVEAVKTGLDGREFGSVYRDALLFLLLTGARVSEVMGSAIDGYAPLTWADVDFESRKVTFRDTKNRSDHMLPMGEWLVAMMQNRKAASVSDVVFSDEAGRVPVNLRGGYDRIRDLTGIHATPHDLRRTFATVVARLDISEIKLKGLLNHIRVVDGEAAENESVEIADTTAGYVSVEVKDLREPMQRIEDYMLREAAEGAGGRAA